VVATRVVLAFNDVAAIVTASEVAAHVAVLPPDPTTDRAAQADLLREIVGQTQVTRAGLGKVLEQAGYSTALAASGLEALDYLKNNPPPDLILLDMFG
jgi:PleD family two-component response regulator